MNLDEEEKAVLLCGHSERLAIAFGIMHTKEGEVVRVIKNLRACVDCDTATKFISRIANGEISFFGMQRDSITSEKLLALVSIFGENCVQSNTVLM